MSPTATRVRHCNVTATEPGWQSRRTRDPRASTRTVSAAICGGRESEIEIDNVQTRDSEYRPPTGKSFAILDTESYDHDETTRPRERVMLPRQHRGRRVRCTPAVSPAGWAQDGRRMGAGWAQDGRRMGAGWAQGAAGGVQPRCPGGAARVTAPGPRIALTQDDRSSTMKLCCAAGAGPILT